MQRMLHLAQRNQQEDGDGALSSQATEHGRWLLLIYHLPSQPSSARSAIWRETKRLGALSLQHGVCLLPQTVTTRAAYARLVRRVEEYGGEASVLETTSPDADWHSKTVARFDSARDEEYAEVVEETARLRAEIEREQGKFTFAELEDEERNLERLRKYLAQAQARDAFGAAGQEKASAAVERCAEVLEACAQEIYAQQPVAAAAEEASGQIDDDEEDPDALR